MKEKTVAFHRRKVTYNDENWSLLSSIRSKALIVMEKISDFQPILYGSVARGDVHKGSDIDFFIEHIPETYLLEMALEDIGIKERSIVQATPWHLVKGSITLFTGETITFPITESKLREIEFYYFGGAIELEDLKKDKRVPGVDKRLILIRPTEDGHIEEEITGREAEVSKLLNVSIDIVRERSQVLTRRDKIGRTGVYLNRVLMHDESFEQVLKEICDKDSNVRRRG
ncbi:MAG: Nucleotidyltransferase domain protein [Candidatus Methanofastidiosum methylothiophilum]|uniref:protein adenylyltransferase n=1 Tax=Candidatus Methanofastidiosum methylothiophilum TaxID=1705564 RepID=A0A150IW29_9EURY|nr:MAG: Nucleotidyltransferase domain protein [Candidatus Methanofastidiosum methylthiophilus]KYC46862.1 MAG: Nucleotidyltransferase domain protein [Candidatus Methanofastidiosum methylthiophilus]KYC49088.1 MAG: Nucleotidyltransferase domain protein [Candidatus Methanofastidiosum methylthiophilus]